MDQQLLNKATRLLIVGLVLILAFNQISAQDTDGVVIGAEIINENNNIKEFKILFNAQLESIDNATYMSYSQSVDKEDYLFFVSSSIKYDRGTYLFRIKLWVEGKDVRTFSKTTKGLDVEDDDRIEDVLNWVSQVVQNINYYNKEGEGEFLQEILIYRPQIRISAGSEPERVDKRNVIKIQKKIYELLQNNSDLVSRCILEKVDSSFTELEEAIDSQAYFYCEYKKDETSIGPVRLHLFLDYDEPCYDKAIDFGTHTELKLDELNKYIETNWVKTFLIERDCD